MEAEGKPLQVKGLPAIGQTLGGKYEIVRLLGEGGMAFVFEANHKRLQQRVAIKLLAPELAAEAELVARFEQEARAVAGLRTKHVARVMDVDATAEGIPYIVMEFLEGCDLDVELQSRKRLPYAEAVDYVLQACAGMLDAHAMGIVHRDLKPANLFLAKEHDGGGERIIKVLDFGISKVVGQATRLTGAGAVMGTVLYMSPEQVRAQPSVDTRADIWSLGVILFELISGQAPWEGSTHKIATQIVTNDPPDLRTLANVPENISDTIRTMMQRDPSRRFSSVRDVIAALAPYAPIGSVGSGIAEQLALGSTAARRRASGTAMMKNTVPMIGAPQAQSVAAAVAAALQAERAQQFGDANTPSGVMPRPSLPSGVIPRPSLPQPATTASGAGPSRGNLGLVLGIVIGLFCAGIVVLVAVTMLQRRARTASPVSSSSAAEINRVPSAGLPPSHSPTIGTSSAQPAPPTTGASPEPSIVPVSPPRRGPNGSATSPSPPSRSTAAPSASSAPAFL